MKEEEGTFSVEVVVNNRFSTSALIDTGASSLLVCDDAAEDLQLSRGAEVRLETVAGPMEAQRTAIASLRLGPIELRDIAAVVVPRGFPCHGLVLGMSALRKLGSLTLRGNTLTMMAHRATVAGRRAGDCCRKSKASRCR